MLDPSFVWWSSGEQLVVWSRSRLLIILKLLSGLVVVSINSSCTAFDRAYKRRSSTVFNFSSTKPVGPSRRWCVTLPVFFVVAWNVTLSFGVSWTFGCSMLFGCSRLFSVVVCCFVGCCPGCCPGGSPGGLCFVSLGLDGCLWSLGCPTKQELPADDHNTSQELAIY